MIRSRPMRDVKRHPDWLGLRIRRENSGSKSIARRKNGRPRPFALRIAAVTRPIFLTGSLFLFLTAPAHGAPAVQYMTKEAFIEQHIPGGSELSEKTISLERQEQDTMARRYNLPSIPSSVPFVLGKDKEGALTGAVSFLVLHGSVYRAYHHVGVALRPDGTIKAVAVMDLKEEKSQEVVTEQFLGQFADKTSRTLRFGEDINAVSGATESSRTVLTAVKVVVAVFLKHVKEPV